VPRRDDAAYVEFVTASQQRLRVLSGFATSAHLHVSALPVHENAWRVSGLQRALGVGDPRLLPLRQVGAVDTQERHRGAARLWLKRLW